MLPGHKIAGKLNPYLLLLLLLLLVRWGRGSSTRRRGRRRGRRVRAWVLLPSTIVGPRRLHHTAHENHQR